MVSFITFSTPSNNDWRGVPACLDVLAAVLGIINRMPWARLGGETGVLKA